MYYLILFCKEESGAIHFYFIKESIISTNNTQQSKSKRPKAEHMVNEAIPFKQVFVLDQEGTKLGVMPTRVAVDKAKSAGFDLVIISDNPTQPVAKILDYGKFKFERQKKRKEAKANQVVTDNKEIRLTPMIGDHDIQTKARKAREFLEKGDRVKVSLKFRGREMARQELGHATLDKFFKQVEDIAKIEKPAALAGRFLDMHLVRDKSKQTTKTTEVKQEAKDAKNEN